MGKINSALFQFWVWSQILSSTLKVKSLIGVASVKCCSCCCHRFAYGVSLKKWPDKTKVVIVAVLEVVSNQAADGIV